GDNKTILGRHPPERRLLLLGGPQSGKTSTANTILGDEVFDTGTETTHSNVGQTEIYGRRVTVVDTPPWAIPRDTEDNAERIRQESQRGGFSYLFYIIVTPLSHINDDVFKNMNIYSALRGMLRHRMQINECL
uniref:AIG1-type G domain-containing protein n=1 Tax=Labrus bergylta TaxID=56723 RepID=A0A3Q3LZZ5_9LABR